MEALIVVGALKGQQLIDHHKEAAPSQGGQNGAAALYWGKV